MRLSRLELIYISLIVSIRLSLTHPLVFGSLCWCHSSQKPFFFVCTKQNKSSEFKVKFTQASNHYKKVLETAEPAYATKTNESIPFQKLGSRYFCRIANIVLNKGNSALPSLFSGPEVLPSASDEAKLFTKYFSKTLNLHDSSIPLPVSPFRTNLKLHDSSITPKMVKKSHSEP